MYLYIDRHSQDPALDRKAEITDLLTFAKQAGIDDVMVFSLEENLNTGHIDDKELSAYLDMMKDVKASLLGAGVGFSINPWATTLHRVGGARLKPGQDFRLMVDPNGKQSDATVCPMCENWRGYIREVWKKYASLKPAYIWIEDDFRFHNHFPLEWGGCFCDEHMRLFSEKAGKKLTREAFVKGLLQPGEVHPYRKIWLDSCRATALENAKLLADAVHSVSPETKVSLMSSAPDSHCAEGRDWHKLFEIIGGAHRIHLPAYEEGRPASYLNRFNSVSMLIRAMTPKDTDILPELENAPWSVYSCSKAFTRFQMISSLPLNVKGITMNLFDMIGTGVLLADGYQDMLAEAKPYLSALNDQHVFDRELKGVKVLYSADSSYTIHTSEGKRMLEIYPNEGWWASALNGAGIPFCYTDDAGVTGGTVAVAGQVLRNYDEAAIRHLFENNRVLLNGEAVETLIDMGLGGLIGVKSARWLDPEYGECAYEKAAEPLFGKTESRVTTSTKTLLVEYAEAPEAVSTLHDARRAYIGCGIALRAGKIMILPYDTQGGGISALLTTVRAALLRRTVFGMDPSVPMVEECPYLQPYYYEDGVGKWLYLVNGSLDSYKGAALRLKDAPKDVSVFERTADGGEWRKADQTYADGLLRIEHPFISMDGVLIRIENA